MISSMEKQESPCLEVMMRPTVSTTRVFVFQRRSSFSVRLEVPNGFYFIFHVRTPGTDRMPILSLVLLPRR